MSDQTDTPSPTPTPDLTDGATPTPPTPPAPDQQPETPAVAPPAAPSSDAPAAPGTSAAGTAVGGGGAAVADALQGTQGATGNDRDTYRPTDAIDAEVDDALAGVDMDDIYASNTPDVTAGRGDQLSGEVGGVVRNVDFTHSEVMVDLVSGMHQGVVPLEQWDGGDPAINSAEAFNVESYDEDTNLYHLNRKGKAGRNATLDSLSVGQVIEAIVVGVNKGGLECRIGQSLKAFMPAGQVDVSFHKDISVFLNEKVQARVQKLDKHGRDIVLSRRQVIEKERAAKKQELLEEIQEGDVRQGVVSNVMDFGAFVDLGGADGLLHVSEMSHNRHVKPGDVVKKGDHVEVKVLKIDRDKNKISLSLRAAMADPWENAAERYKPGSTVTGRVVKTTNFGAFLEVDEGLEGLLPMSEMSYHRIGRAEDVVKEGETVRVMVLDLDEPRKKLTFSLKQTQEDPWAEVQARFPEGSTHPATITRVADFGAFAQLEPGLEGLIHISELADTRTRATSDVVREGQTVQARILNVDSEQRRLRLSLRSEKAIANDAKKQGDVKRTPDKSPEEIKARQKKLKKSPLKGGLDF